MIDKQSKEQMDRGISTNKDSNEQHQLFKGKKKTSKERKKYALIESRTERKKGRKEEREPLLVSP